MVLIRLDAMLRVNLDISGQNIIVTLNMSRPWKWLLQSDIRGGSRLL
jgi:hypothetical protein